MSFLLSNSAGVFLFAATVLAIMKVIGYVLLIAVIVLAVLIVCVLFVPVRYRARGNIDEMTFDIKLHWFFRIIMFRFRYKNSTSDYALYLFGIRTRLFDKERMDKRKERRNKRKIKKAARKRRSRKKKYQKEHDKYKEQFLKENQMEEIVSGDKPKGKSPDDSVGDERTEDSREAGNASSSDTSISGAQKAMALVKKIFHILKTICEYQPIRMLWDDIRKFLYHARPRKIRADILFGFEDPSMTGKALGAISNLYFIYQFKDLHINGDFETDKAYVCGTFDVRGYVQAVFGLIFVIRVIRKKQFRSFLKAIKL